MRLQENSWIPIEDWKGTWRMPTHHHHGMRIRVIGGHEAGNHACVCACNEIKGRKKKDFIFLSVAFVEARRRRRRRRFLLHSALRKYLCCNGK